MVFLFILSVLNSTIEKFQPWDIDSQIDYKQICRLCTLTVHLSVWFW